MKIQQNYENQTNDGRIKKQSLSVENIQHSTPTLWCQNEIPRKLQRFQHWATGIQVDHKRLTTGCREISWKKKVERKLIYVKKKE